MKWNFLKKCWLLPGREAHPPPWRKSQPAKPRVRLWLEDLESRLAPTFSLGAAANYAIIYEGGAGNTLQIANSTTNTPGSGVGQGGGIGNIGVGGSGSAKVTGGGPSVNGNIDFAAANTGQFSGNSPSGTVNYSVAAVTSALDTVNALNTTLGALPGTNVAINGNTTINASDGTFSASGTGYTNVRVFDVTSFSLKNGQTLAINGDANGDSVVLNFTSSTTLNGNIVLTGGLTPDDVIFNFVGGSNLTGGPDLSFSTGMSGLAQGIFLDPNGSIGSNPSNIVGRIFGGDSAKFQFGANANITAPGSGAAPTLTTTPTPSTVTLDTNSVTLKDTADLEGGNSPTGTLTFTLFYNGGSTPVHTEVVDVNGNGSYTTPTGFTLPTTGTVAGVYQWDAFFSGNTRNNTAIDFSDSNEQVTVNPASPTLTTTPTPTTVTPGATAPPLLTDTADLEGGYHPTGDITFELFLGSTLVHTETVAVSGNGAYTTPTGYTLPSSGTVTGTYTWTAHYGGDANNNAASDQGGTAEQVTVAQTSPTLLTTASPPITLGTTAPTLSDSAVLSGGYFPGGSIVFMVSGPGGFSYTQTDTVNGNGTYAASTMLPTTGTVAGTYTWTVSYAGDANNNAASDQGGTTEQTVVSPASPTLVTTASPNVTLPTGPPGTVTLTDSAVLSGGYFPTGNVVFTLSGPGGFSYTQTDTVNGNGTYTASTTLPTTGMVAGTYTWTVTYDGDASNHTVTETGSAANGEQTVVSPANPLLVTTASAASRQGTRAATLTDSAVLSGGYFPTGNVVFTLSGPGGFSYTQTDTVNGNGTYTASTTLPTTGMVAGTYTWTVTYDGDASNHTVTETGSAANGEQTVVSPANPLLVTTASAASRQGTRAATLTDSAVLSGGYFPTGNLVFMVSGPGGFSYTQTDTVSGNGTYTASTPLPTTGTVAGTYTWTAHYGGDANNNAASDQGGSAEQVTVAQTSPTLVTTASPALTLGSTAPTLSDSAVLAGGFNPTGNLVFMLSGPGGFSYTQTDTVSGNNTYTASTTLPTTGTVAGTYTWTVNYAGDANNNAALDQGGPTEQTVVSPANPTLLTTASPAITLGTTTPTLSDSAVLAGGYFPTGNLVFMLTGPGGFSYTQTDTVNGNSTYTASTTLPTAGTVAGTYTWTVTYGGDANNNAALDQGGTAEQTVVSPANPTLVTTASPNVTLPSGPPGTVTLTDSAVLSGGYFPTGNVVFTLSGPGGFSYTQTDTVSGNNTYTASTTLPTTGMVAGTYTWTVTYDGDASNHTVTETGSAANGEQTVVSPANPLLVTTASAASRQGTRAATLTDSAVLSGGYFPTGNLVFMLSGPGGFSYTQTDTVNGNGTYTASTPLPTTGTVAGTYTWTAHYGGDANNNAASDQGGSAEQVTVAQTSPTLLTTASPALTLGSTAPTLSDSAVLAGGFNPTGNLVFMLSGPGGFSYTQTDTVSGNNTYTASTTLPTTGTVAGTYTWTVSYAGDANNNAALDQGGPTEQTVVSPANPTLLTTASPALTLGTTAPTLSDSAVLSGGYFPGGSIVFMVSGPGGFSYTQTDTVNGNNTYTASTTLPTTGMVAGTYTWTVSYAGDANNNAASDQGGTAEQTVISPASPTLVTTASPNVTLPTGPPGTVTLTDSAVLSGGYFPTGSIVFTLTGPGGFSYTQTDTVNGNGTYTASTTLPTTGMVAGTYTWTVTYDGDASNHTVTETGSAANGEQTVVSPASPTLTTTPNLTTVTLGATTPPLLIDSATLSGGYHPTGDITFELFLGSTLVHTETVAVSGNATYTTPTGFTLPSAGAVAGTYQWVAVYSGDANNVNANESNPAAEQVTVNPASPTLVTAASPSTVTLPATVPTILTDTADLTGGYFPGGSIVFTLTGPGGFSYTQTDAVSGNGTYSAQTTLPSTGTVAGTYTWTARYGGDPNNHAANDQGGPAEQTVVSPASLTLVTLASPDVTLPTGPPGSVTLSDSAFLSGGHFPTGNIVFTLSGPGGFSDTQTDMVSGNGTYTASTALPTTGTVVGTYAWTARYSGDPNNNAATDQGGTAEQTVVSLAKPTLVTLASPDVTLPTGPPGSVTLSDSALLSGGYFPTGNVVFTLTGPGGFSYTQTDTVSGNGTYTASTTLPTTGTVVGTYTWTARYGGDGNNNAATDQGGPAEQTVVGPASPTLVTTASSAITQAGTRAPTLTDTALLSGGYFPTGTVVFTLTGPNAFSYTQTDAVNGNGTYSASTTLPTTVAGTYTWTAHYSGNANNNAASDQGGRAEQVTVSPASPTLVTTASPDVTLPAGPPGTVTLSDSANLASGVNPTGTITFTLFQGGTLLATETVQVSGNGTYTTPTGFTLPTTGTVTGTYQWDASYSGDTNNNAASDNNDTNEQVTVSAASPTLTTTPNPTTAPLGTTLQDLADLTGGYHPAGSITFRLYAPGVNPTVGPATYTETVAAVNGNGPYHTTVGFASHVTGIWHWVATYNGDSNNNSVSSGPLDEPVTVPRQADLVVSKTVSNATPNVGATITYTITLTDLGPDAASNVTIRDLLPAGLAFVSASPSQGTYNATTGIWTVGTVAVGAPRR